MYDVIIIGGSFAGVAAALQLARARRQVLVLDSSAPRNRFAHHAHGVLGHDGRPPLDLLADARMQLLRYPTVRFVLATAEQVVHESDEDFQVIASNGEQARARRLILASGVNDVLPPIPGLAERWGVGVVHCPTATATKWRISGLVSSQPGSWYCIKPGCSSIGATRWCSFPMPASC